MLHLLNSFKYIVILEMIKIDFFLIEALIIACFNQFWLILNQITSTAK